MYNCKRRTKVVPVRRRCCLSLTQCALTLKAPGPPCLKAPVSLPNPQTASIVYPPLPQKTQLLPSFYTPTIAASTTSQYPICLGLPAAPCLLEAPCPASFNQVAPCRPTLSHFKLGPPSGPATPTAALAVLATLAALYVLSRPDAFPALTPPGAPRSQL